MNLWYKDTHKSQKAETTTKQQKKISEKSLKHHVTPQKHNIVSTVQTLGYRNS